MSGLERDLEALQQLSLQDLRAQWMDQRGHEPPKSMSPQLLRLAIAYALQERVHGGLSRQAKFRLKSISNQVLGKAVDPSSRRRIASPPATMQIKPGTRFLREWQGQTHEVTVLEDGKFVHEGRVHRSLTAIARAITGTHQSGPIFFGLSKQSPSRANP